MLHHKSVRLWCLASVVVCANIGASCGRQNDSQPVPDTPAPDPTTKPQNPEPPSLGSPTADIDVGKRSANNSFAVKVEWLSGPESGPENQARFIFSAPDGAALAPIKIVTLKPWMPIHGHGTPTRDLKIVPEADKPNSFLVSSLNFIMSGPWELQISATVLGVSDTAIVAVQVP